MRMWNVDPRLMCRKHLLGEHVETHMFVGSILKGTSLKGYVAKGLVEVHNLRARHDELVVEMQRRGMNHKTPLQEFTPWVEGQVDSAHSLVDLASRCPDCARLMEAAHVVHIGPR